MADAYRPFASYLLFKEISVDTLGHLYRAGAFGPDGVGRTVWLRIFDGSSLRADDVVSCFPTVSKIASAVQSANVATGVDCFSDGGAPALVIDYLAAQPLNRVFDRVDNERFPVPVDNALLILEKISLGLAAALTSEVEGARIVHGFLHPGLVFVSNDGESIVSGFGFADALFGLVEDELVADDVHPYLAPEVLLTRTPSQRADVYSLGAILYRLLTGERLPTRAEQRDGIIEAAKLAYDGEPLPNDIKVLLARALAARPEERFSSAADFKKELDKLLYGGAYSPTTFNLALFMDRLFRGEIEETEKERAAEEAVDVTPFLTPTPEVEPEAVVDAGGAEPRGHNKSLWIGLGAVAVVIVAIAGLFSFGRGLFGPPPVPTPTAEEIAAQRLAQEEKMRLLAQNLVQEMMAEKEAEIREELTARQARIEELQQRLSESERRAGRGELTREEQKNREALQRQIAAEEEAQRKREAEFEAERQRAVEEARQQAAAHQAMTATAVAEEAALPAAEKIEPTPTPIPVVSIPEPTAVADRASPTPAPMPTVVVKENSFVDPTEVDSLPVVLKEHPVTWPRAALYSRRQGVVIVQATVNANGQVEEVKVLRADHEGFGIPDAVVDAVRSYRFKPATKNGVRVKSFATVTQRYRFVAR